MRYSDSHLNYWGDIYCRARLNEYDLPFAVFIRDPWKCLREFGIDDTGLPAAGDHAAPMANQGQGQDLGGRSNPPATVHSLAEARARRMRTGSMPPTATDEARGPDGAV